MNSQFYVSIFAVNVIYNINIKKIVRYFLND